MPTSTTAYEPVRVGMSHLAADKYLYSVNKGGKVTIAAPGKDSFNLFDIKAASGAAAKYNWQTYRGKDSADGTLSEDDIISVNKVTGEVTGRAVGTSYVIANEPGDATMTAVYKVEVKPAAAVAFPQVAGGRDFSIGLKADGTVWAWGNNQYGQLGDGRISGTETYPKKIAGLSNIVKIAAAGHSAYALTADSKVYA